MFYIARSHVINFFNHYSIIESEATHKDIKGEAIQLITPKQIFKRFPAAVPKSKAGSSFKIYELNLDKICILCINDNKYLKKYITI